ncbi:MAG: PhoPQ-activated pathogenicity-like protein PqaA type [Bacteroidales bacterium]|nr:PhoPQ-activated pathogenicity-like protein PqaA type [Bacteroidales bacterium]
MQKITWLLTFSIILFLFNSCTAKHQSVPAETALQDYLNNKDKNFSYEVLASYNLYQVQAYKLLLTSQDWQDITWKHTLTVLVPDENNYDGAMLFITGGKNENGEPIVRGGDDKFIDVMSKLAKKNKAIVAIIWQVPNQPLFDDLTEDALISFTLHNFKNDGDYTWPLLFPMVKSAVRAMDAIQDFATKNLNHEISRFVVTGASKRGWTTWLTGASDPRVEAIAPMVIDVLNMPVSLDYQVKVWQDYSIQIEDYVKLGIPQDVHTDNGNEITTMIDPYSYRNKLTMPKLIFIGTNDEYWPVDAIKNYLNDIPGENYIHYEPNAGHDLDGGENSLLALSAFFGRTLNGGQYPICNWNISQNSNQLSLSVETSPEELIAVNLWSASSADRDFRDEVWTSKNISLSGNKNIDVKVDLPESGFNAFYLDLSYPDPNGGEYTKSTRMFVTNEIELLED